MWRSFLLAVGMALIVMGGECLIIDDVTVYESSIASVEEDPYLTKALEGPKTRVVEPPEWAPWGLITAGAIVMLFAATRARPAA